MMHVLGISSYTLGLVFILLVSVIWAAASILVQYLYSEHSFDSPFLLTYIGTSLFTLLLPSQWLCQQLQQRRQNDTSDYESISPSSPTSSQGTGHVHTQVVQVQVGLAKWSTADHVRAAAKIAPIWFLANYSYNASLKYTSITSSTVLASTGSLFTFLFALLLRDEHFSVWKLLGVSLGITGSILTGLHDIEGTTNQDDNDNDNDDTSDDRLWGDALGLLSAVGYGGYAVMVRILCPHDESLMSMQLFLGFVGVFNMVLLSPIAIYQVVEYGKLTALVFGFLIIRGLLDNVLSDYLWARSVVLTSATVATVGLGLTIPLAFMSDVALGRPNVLDASSIVGALAVLVGFVLVNIGQKQEDEIEHAQPAGAIVRVPPESEELQPQDAWQQQQQQQQQVPLENQYRQRLSMEYRDAESFSEEMT
jgi:solute carrier family 35 protein F5